MIETRDVYRYGYYEAKIKIPGTGWWPVFWMWHHDEIDIMENFWDDTKFSYNLYGNEGCPKSNEFSANINDGNFHTYAVELTPFSLNEWGNAESGSFNLNSKALNISYQGYFKRKIKIVVLTPCQNSLNIEIDIPPCDECCPEGFEYGGANCHSGFHFTGVEGFIYDEKFYTKPNCKKYLENKCCPPGSVFDGANCYFGIHFKDDSGSIYNNSFYTKPLDCYNHYNYKVEKNVDYSSELNLGTIQEKK